MKRLACIIAVMVLWLSAHVVSAQTPGIFQAGETFKGKRGPVNITSQRLEAEYDKKRITFIGDVIARQQDFTLYADRLVLFINDEGKDIEKIVALGKVRMVQGGKTALCREATYYHREGKVVLVGQPMMKEGDSSVKGTRITSSVSEQKTVAGGDTQGGGRVTITIIPDKVKK
jgi:lipopolysaccharide export system protein LptA